MGTDTALSRLGESYTSSIVWLLHQPNGWAILLGIIVVVILLVIWLSHIAHPEPRSQNNNQYQQRRGNDPDYW